jgi:hypothetical protein
MRYGAPITVNPSIRGYGPHLRWPIEAQSRQSLFGAFTKGLLVFRCIDLGQANLERPWTLAACGQRVAVGDPNLDAE